MTNGDMGDEKITVMHLISQLGLRKRTRQRSRILADYDLEGYLVRTDPPKVAVLSLFLIRFEDIDVEVALQCTAKWQKEKVLWEMIIYLQFI